MKKLDIAIIGLGYVGLPLAIAFSKKRKVLAFDINFNRIKELKLGFDKNLQEKKNDLKNRNLIFTNSPNDLNIANCFIITVPTPINLKKQPDLSYLISASLMIGKLIKKKDLIIYESTVYPGCIEEDCVPILEKYSGLKYNQDFFCGYSPERINPGDPKHKISNIKKITSGSNIMTAKTVDNLYREIVKSGTFKASSIKVAEAAKVIENTQRDINIALINELSILFNKMKIDSEEVLAAAATKWNFIKFKPGLVGGHCIGVDPYYLTYKAKKVGYFPKLVLSGRKINDNMGKYVANEFIKALNKKNILTKKSKILIMGLTFKENCPDLRNSGSKIVVNNLIDNGCQIELYDPWVTDSEIQSEYGSLKISKLKKNFYDGIIITVGHKVFKEMGFSKISNLCKKKRVIYDLKFLFPSSQVDLRL